ncbi:MAG: hypothetical protein LDLANPLL_01498 [Turneriella sp.]|nr:hypothetical protein [Turneriella sp.]
MLGVGLRAKHFPHLLKKRAKLDFFEILSENYIDTEGRPLSVVERLRRDYPMCMHGVSLSIGSLNGVRADYLKKLKNLADKIEPFLISDHFCFTGLKNFNSHDLLPLPFTQKMVSVLVKNIDYVQNFLKTTIALENASSYLSWRQSEMPEWEFINEVVRRSGCKILLDVNNVYVNAVNHRFSADVFLNAINPTDVAEIHIAGYSDMETHLFDTHSMPVYPVVWKLWEKYAYRFAKTPAMVERDDDIPAFPALEREVLRMGELRKKSIKKNNFTCEKQRTTETKNKLQENLAPVIAKASSVGALQKTFLDDIKNQSFISLDKITAGGTLTRKAALQVYHTGYTARLSSALESTYEAVWYVLGDKLFFKACKEYIKKYPSDTYNLNSYGENFPKFLKKRFVKMDFLPHLALFEKTFYGLFNAKNPQIKNINYNAIDPTKTVFNFFSTVHLLHFPYKIFTLWKNRAKISDGYIPSRFAEVEYLVLYKMNDAVEIQILTHEQFQIAQALHRKKSLAEALKGISAPPKKIQELFASLAQPGIIESLSTK